MEDNEKTFKQIKTYEEVKVFVCVNFFFDHTHAHG